MLRRRMLIMLGVVLLVVLLLAGYKAFSVYQQIQMFSAPKPPVSVAVATAAQQPWEARLPTVGSLKALQGVDLSLETAGTVQKVQFQSGQKVKAGQPLLQLDSDVESALLETAEADLGLSQLDFGRGRQLVGSQAISKGEFDRLSAQLKKTRPQSINSRLRWPRNTSWRRSAAPSAFARWTSATTWPAAR